MDTKELQDKLFKTFDPNSGYSIEDFNKELESINFNKIDYKIGLNFVNKSNNPDPEFGSEYASGFDIRAYIPDGRAITLSPRKSVIIETGLYFDIPQNMEIQVRSRSGLAFKNDIICSWGTVDYDYTGEVKVKLFNLGDTTFFIRNGDRIAQGVLAGCLNKQLVNLEKVNKIEKITDRAESGFGSTGIA